jgi:hypothetical protein
MSKRWQSWANCFLCLFIVVQTTLVSRAVAAAAAPKDGSRLIYVYELVDPPVDADDYDEIAALVSMQGLSIDAHPFCISTMTITAAPNTGWKSCRGTGGGWRVCLER